MSNQPPLNPDYYEDGIPPCMIFVDKEANWFHNGKPIINNAIYQLFYQHVSRDEKGRYLITMGKEKCYLEVEDTLYVIQKVKYLPSRQGKPEQIELLLNDETKEPLSPETLWIGRDNVPYCMVKGGTYPARFLRPAYYMLAQHIVEDDQTGGFRLLLNGISYPVAEDLDRVY